MKRHNNFILTALILITEERKMKNIYNKVKAIFNVTNNESKLIDCNYSNNYYGDQYCRVEH